MKRQAWHLLAALALTFSMVAPASGPRAVRERVESTLHLSGTIDIGVDGRVEGVAVKGEEQLAPAVRQLLEQATSQWRFEPVRVDGKPAPVRAPFNVRLVAKEGENDSYIVRIASASFAEADSAYGVRKASTPPPDYPSRAGQHGVSGTVFLLARVDRDGTVADVVAEQVNLRVISSETQQERWRKVLADRALAAARNWRFHPPEKGPLVDDPYWLIRIPVDFVFRGEDPQASGFKWDAYVPGPRTPVPWLDPSDARLGADAVAGGGIHTLGIGPRLLTPLSDD